jgi:CO dehydrogenase/acetyl-CoA synthase gamma subunit (corrinoid Fe-S protein)
MRNLASTATSTSTLPEQTITASLTAEIMNDLENGQPTLLASTEANLGDLAEVSPTTLMCKVREARAQLDQIEQLALDLQAQADAA